MTTKAQAKKLKKSKPKKRGGARPGAGHPKTGINNMHIGMSVPIKYADLIKAMVKSKIIELRESEIQVVKKTATIKAAAQAGKKPNTDYLQQRRNSKLKVK